MPKTPDNKVNGIEEHGEYSINRRAGQTDEVFHDGKKVRETNTVQDARSYIAREKSRKNNG